MVSFGDVEIPWITEKDSSISKDIVEKNFVDRPPEVYELTSNLESGTYSLILNESVQEKDETFVEQEDAVLSMVSRHGTEFPFASAGDSGYIVVESASVNTFPSLEIKEAEVEIRFLDDDVYYSGVRAEAKPIRRGDYDVEATPVESVVAFPTNLNVSSNGSSLSPDYQVNTEDEVLDLYVFDEKTVFEFEEYNIDRTYSQTESICRLFTLTGERIYSGDIAIESDGYINNSLVEVDYQDDRSHIDYYDGSEWQGIGRANLTLGDGHASVNTNDEIELTFVNGYRSSVYRGLSAASYTFDKKDRFYFTFDEDNFTEISLEDYYGHWQDANGNDVIVVNPFEDGDFFTYTNAAAIESLIPGTEYTIYVAVVPDGINASDYARYLYNHGRRMRTFTQK